MKLDILDAYNIRARLSPSIILLGPISLTLFLCFEDVYNFASSAIIVCILLAMTNYVPVLQRRLNQSNKDPRINYAAVYLHLNDDTIDEFSKRRYYHKFAELDESFSMFTTPDNTPEFRKCCESAILYLRNNTRDNHLVLEENINCGFCKNMLANKMIGIILNIVLGIATGIYSYIKFDFIADIPLGNKVSILFNAFFLLFWIFGVNKSMMEHAAKRYATTLLSAIDTLKPNSDNK